MSKTIKSLAVIVLLSILVVAVFIIVDINKSGKQKDVHQNEIETPNKNESNDSFTDVVGTEGPSTDLKEEEFAASLELNLNADMTEDDIQHVIHHMSHQKIIADTKRGKIPLTNKTVEQLDEFLMNASIAETYDSIDIYRTISNKWMDGDFSAVDEDHNAIWRLQNGEIGHATGVMTVSQEIEYIEYNYGKDFYEYLVDQDELTDH